MRTTFSLQFYCRKSKSQKNGLAPVELSIIINQKRVFVNLPRKEYPDEFKKSITQRKNNPIKDYLNEVRNQFNQIQVDMMKNNIPLTSDSLRDYFKTGGVKPYTVEDMWSEYLTLQSKRIGKTISKMAYDKYVSARNTFFDYVDKNTEVTQIIPSTIENILVNLQAKYKEGTVCSIMTKIKTVITFAKDNGKLQINPFTNIKYGRGKRDIEFLTEEEINTLKTKTLDIDRLDKVRDLAVFQIASGLSYIDTQNLKPEDIHFEEDGTCYIYKPRKKTDVEYTAVVFPEGVEILRKYDFKLPSISNQKGNAYLKEIQTLCKIDKSLHFHLFRKTYATRLINKGVRLETVSKCLGHSSTQITQMAYSKLLKKTVIDEVKQIF